ncbi:hypothetical protein OH77DRAFT_1427483 [Trametes cingulata]|nr:hypothetical protein OH77DRAFT_1427483 [Trametes cingulata]
MGLLDLPDELLAHIASNLQFHDLLTIQQVCARWRDIVKSNAALQYHIELRVAGMVDNPPSRLVPGERLRVLRAKEEAWRTLDLTDKRSLMLGHRPSGIYDLTGGTLLLGERRVAEGFSGTDAVHTINLHSAFAESGPRAPPTLWSNIDLGKQVIDVGLAIQEHDLIAVVTYQYVNEARLLAAVDIHLLKHSTGQPHPAAAKSVIHFDTIHYLPGHCSIMLEISGDTLCFLLNNYFPFINADPVTLVVYNWKTGRPVVGQKRLYSDPTMFNSFILLSPDTVVLPIIPMNALEICKFGEELAAPPPPPPPGTQQGIFTKTELPELKTTCVLQLPPLHPGGLVLRMTCRCEPNPRGPSSSATSTDKVTPYYSDPEKAVMILHLHVRLTIGITRVYTMIVHRSSLIKTMNDALERQRVQKAARAAKAASSSSQTVEDSLTEFLDPREPRSDDDMTDDEEHVGPQVLGPFQNHPFAYEGPPRRRRRSPWLAGAGSHSDGGNQRADEPPTLIWEEWGPAVTRWFQDELAGTRWITTTCGQRFVRVRSDGRLHVFDFNRLGIKRYVHGRSLSGEPVGALPGEEILEENYSEFSPRIEEDAVGLVEEDEEEEDEEAEEEDEDEVEVEEDIYVDTDEEDGNEQEEDAGHDLDVRRIRRLAQKQSLPERQMKVVLGTTTIQDSDAWEIELESSLPYIEMSVPAPDDYESVLLDEDIIVGLKMDTEGRHIREIVLHQIGGPIA